MDISIPDIVPNENQNLNQKPIIKTSTPPKITPPPPSKNDKKNETKTWWLITSVILIIILCAGLIVATYFCFNYTIIKETNCEKCCQETPFIPDALSESCLSSNTLYCRNLQNNFQDNISLIAGQFLLFYPLQSNNLITNNNSFISTLGNPTTNISSLNLSHYVSNAENLFAKGVSINNRLYKRNNLKVVLTISTTASITTILPMNNKNMPQLTANFYNIGFQNINKLDNNEILEVKYINGKLIGQTKSKNFYFLAVNSMEAVLGPLLFNVNNENNSAVFAVLIEGHFTQTYTYNNITLLNPYYSRVQSVIPYYINNN